jgi:hypothetical protein
MEECHRVKGHKKASEKSKRVQIKLICTDIKHVTQSSVDVFVAHQIHFAASISNLCFIIALHA